MTKDNNHNDPLQDNREMVENIMGSKQAQQIASVLQGLDPKTMEKLQGMAKNIDKTTLGNMMKSNKGNIQNALQSEDLMAKLKKLLKG